MLHFLPLLRALFLTFCLIGSLFLSGQTDFRAGYEREDPAPADAGNSPEERLATHREWLTNAEANNDTLLRIFGEIYLFYDYARLNDFATGSTHILNAEQLAAASGNPGWRGGVAFRRSHLHTYLREPEKRMSAVKDALAWCGTAGDSLCVAESLESLSSTYAFMDSFELAHHYFERALPMLRKFGQPKHIKTALSNYGSLLTSEGRPGEAIPFLMEAREISEALGDKRGISITIHNLANAYRFTGDVGKAISGFKEALAYNEEQGYYDRVVRNYAGLRQSYQEIGDYQSAIAYQEKFYNLQDSLIGSQTKIRIAELEAQYLESEQALELEKSQRALLVSNQRVERRGIILFALVLLALFAATIWWRQHARQRTRILESKKNLGVVTRLLKEKNEALIELKEETRMAKPDPQRHGTDGHVNLFDHSILTNTDWLDFKAYFDGSFPGFVHRLRNKYPELTEAEERLFLLIKLNLTSKEIANILGISSSGVKKTRNRLRKKLPLAAEESLENHVLNF